MATGIKRRHSASCPGRDGGRCRCGGGWEASVYSKRDGKKIRKTFGREAEAKSWRADAITALEQGSLRAPTKITIREAGETWLAGAEAGEIRSRSGQRFKPSTLRGYRQALSDRIYPEIGGAKLSAITTSDLQALVDRWQAEGQRASTIRNTVKPLQAIYRRARSRGGLPVNPTHDLELPAPRPKEVEIVAPEVAAQLLDALPDGDRAIWATALYGGLRYGELRALRWGAVDLVEGRIEVRESWDPQEGKIEPKTRTSRRVVPIPSVLQRYLLDHKLSDADPDDGELVFGEGESVPFHAASLYRRADRAWQKAGEAGFRERYGREPTDEEAEQLDPQAGALRLHQARHSFASFMIAASVNPKALSSIMGHSSIKVTFDLYGHLMPGAEREAAALLDGFLRVERSQADKDEQSTGADLGAPSQDGCPQKGNAPGGAILEATY